MSNVSGRPVMKRRKFWTDKQDELYATAMRVGLAGLSGVSAEAFRIGWRGERSKWYANSLAHAAWAAGKDTRREIMAGRRDRSNIAIPTKVPTLKGVDFIVECRTPTIGGAGIWEVIAAFNVGRVALDYALDAWRSNRRNRYRVWNRKLYRLGPVWDSAAFISEAPTRDITVMVPKRKGKVS